MSTLLAQQDIGIIVLAAGSSKRFGEDKRFAILNNGDSILESTLSSIPTSFTRKILVLKTGDDKLVDQFGERWQICIADAPETGMANSLASAIALAQDWEGALIALGDMPFVTPSCYLALQQALLEHNIAIPVHSGRQGNPVAFRKKFFIEIERLKGDQGAKSLLEKYQEDVYQLEIVDEGVFRDIDNPKMLI